MDNTYNLSLINQHNYYSVIWFKYEYKLKMSIYWECFYKNITYLPTCILNMKLSH